MARRSNTAEFIKKAEAIHQDENGIPLYDYSEVDYKDAHTPIDFKCTKCGGKCTKTPTNHLYSRQGCNDYKKITTKLNNRKKYGTDHPTQNVEVQNKRRYTCIDLYGVDNVMKLKDHQDKANKTNRSSRNGLHNTQTLKGKEQRAITCEFNWGVPHALQNDILLQKKYTNIT